MQVIKAIFAGCLMVWLLSVASCAMLGYGTTVMVDALANSDAAKKIAKRQRERELERHNERANRDSAYRPHERYYSDY